MKASSLTKYVFRIRTRNGVVVENLMISGRDESDAERKLLQIYLGCEVLKTSSQPQVQTTRVAASYEKVMDLITR